jgi:hypothetical protein
MHLVHRKWEMGMADESVGSLAEARPSFFLAGSREKRLLAGLWALVALVVTVLVYRRFNVALGAVPRMSAVGVGDDFGVFFHAARAVAAGKSPYVHGYVYSPVVALFIAPFSHVPIVDVWRAWTMLSILAFVVAGGIVATMATRQHAPWCRPALFGFCIVTGLQFVPAKLEFWHGETDTFVIAAFAVALWLLERERKTCGGAAIGIGGLVKTWPFLCALALFQKDCPRRWRAITGFVASALLAPVLAAAVGGLSGLLTFLKSTFDARSQHLISDSVWGIPALLFSRTGLARPVFVSPVLRDVTSGLLLASVVALLVVSLRTGGSPGLTFWNVSFAIVLLLPVSHLNYTLFALPVLWLWSARALSERTIRRPEVAIAGALVLWWLVLNKTWPGEGSSAAISSLRYCVPFLANMVACTISILGLRVLHSRDGQRMETGTPALPSSGDVAEHRPVCPPEASRDLRGIGVLLCSGHSSS